MTYTKIFLCCLMLCVLGITGCNGNGTLSGSNSSTCSDWGTGGGYSMKLCATNSILHPSGTTILNASVRDAQGNPVNDSSTSAVSFSSSLGATIGTTNNSINLGTCTTTYTAPAACTAGTSCNIPGVDQITTSYHGAYAYVSIYVSP